MSAVGPSRDGDATDAGFAVVRTPLPLRSSKTRPWITPCAWSAKFACAAAGRHTHRAAGAPNSHIARRHVDGERVTAHGHIAEAVAAVAGGRHARPVTRPIVTPPIPRFVRILAIVAVEIVEDYALDGTLPWSAKFACAEPPLPTFTGRLVCPVATKPPGTAMPTV